MPAVPLVKYLQVTFSVKNRKCLLPIVRYDINTLDVELAEAKAWELLKADSDHHERYKVSLVSARTLHGGGYVAKRICSTFDDFATMMPNDEDMLRYFGRLREAVEALR
jgi:hypothetical protein